MLKFLLRPVAELDRWLHTRLGRPYRLLLTIGLGIEFVQQLMEIPERVKSARGVTGLLLVEAVNLALLIHQLSEFSERFGGRGAGDPDRVIP